MASEIDLSHILQANDRSAFEPKVPAIVANESFAFVRTTGVRNAPEVLVLELFREIYYDPFSRTLKETQLSPDTADFDRAEKAVLYVARGRLKRIKNSGVDGFYAPVFPEQARGGWLRRKTDRALRHHLIQGAMAHALCKANAAERRAVAETIVDAIKGRLHAASPTDVEDKEILSATVASVNVDSVAHGLRTREAAIEELVGSLAAVEHGGPAMHISDNDALAERITDDFVGLCELEGRIPRLLWLDLLKCFLRLAVPAWVLGHMKITLLLRDWAMAAVESRSVPLEGTIRGDIASRWHDLFHPTRTGTNELAMHVERYMKARVELSTLLYLLKNRGNESLFAARLSVASPGSDLVTVEELLTRFATMPLQEAGAEDARRLFRPSLMRCVETFGAWTNPLKKGQGKNIDEFLRVLRRFEPPGDDTGFLAEKTGPAEAVVFPGPNMIRLGLLLAALEKGRKHQAQRGKLVLADLESHFHSYGLEFAASAGARPKLIAELSRLGLLKGSPDAGEYTELLVPIEIGRSGKSASAGRSSRGAQ
jgi:hypothetical protein